MRIKFLALILAIAMVFTMLVGCTKAPVADPNSGAEAVAPEDMEPFRISMVTPLTGNNAYAGHEYQYGAELAFKHIGGEINGRKVELVIADGPDSDTSVSEFERLYSEGSRVFLSGYGSNADRTFATMCDEMGVLYFSLNWANDLIQIPDSDYFFRTGANVTDFSKACVNNAVYLAKTYLDIDDPKDLRIAVMYGTSRPHVANPILEAAEEAGVQVVMFEGYADDTKDYTTLIEKLKATEYDIFIPVQGSDSGAPFLKKMFEMGYRPNVILASGIYYDTPNFADLGNDITNGIFSSSYTTPKVSEEAAKGVTKFSEDFEADYGHIPLTHALAAYTGMSIIFKVLESVDPADWDKIENLSDATKALDIQEGELPWYWGVKFENCSNTRATQMILGEWLDGVFECVGPDKLATKEAVFLKD